MKVVLSLEQNYTGYIEVTPTDDEFVSFYSDLTQNRYGLMQNQYLIMYDADGKPVDYYKWDGEKHVKVAPKAISTEFVGKVKPRNPQQVCAMDMLADPNITIKVLGGVYGSGKDLLMLSYALQAIGKGQYEKLVYIRNNIELKDTTPIGALPNGLNDKLAPYAAPLADHLGGRDALRFAMDRNTVELQHLGFLRGRDIKHSILYITEAENLTRQQVQLIIGRVGEGSVVFFNGDTRQTDKKVFENNSGLTKMVEKLPGKPRFGYVYMPISERSETARYADYLDE